MSNGKAPGGAFPTAAHQPAILLNRPMQGAVGPIEPSVTRIARMLRQIPKNARTISAWECMEQDDGRRATLVDGEVEMVETRSLVGDSLQKARQARDSHLDYIKCAIDYHLTTLAYEDVPCTECRLPLGAAAFAAALPEFEPPAIRCGTCFDRGVVRSERTDDQSKADAKLVKYWSAVLDDTARCAEIKAATSEANRAYCELELANRMLFSKFANEKRTQLEGQDAEQAVRQGLVDAAVRFDPTKQKAGKYCCAVFSTVAYWWCRRNCQARHPGWKRAGLYAQSIDAWKTPEGMDVASQITTFSGALGVIGGGGRHNGRKTAVKQIHTVDLVVDLREKVAALPELQRAVVEAKLDGLATGEISTRLNISRVKVRQLRNTAFETLRSTLGGYVSTLHD